MATNIRNSGILVWLRDNRTLESFRYTCKRNNSSHHCSKFADNRDNGLHTALLISDFTLHDRIDVIVKIKGAPSIEALSALRVRACLHDSKALQVQANGDPLPKGSDFTWFHNGKAVRSKQKPYTFLQNRTILLIGDLTKKEAGFYSVQVVTATGIARVQFDVSAMMLPPNITIKSPRTILTGINGKASFRISIAKAQYVHWEFKGKRILPSKHFSYSASELVIRDAQLEHYGMYKVVAQRASCISSIFFNLIVKDELIPEPFPYYLNTFLGGTVDTTVKFRDGSPKAVIKWWKRKHGTDRRVETDSSISLIHNRIMINKVTEEHAGIYTMAAIGGIYGFKAIFRLRLLSNPFVVAEEHLYTTEVGRAINLTIDANGNPYPEIKWFKNDKELTTEGERYLLVERKNILMMTKVKLSDAGSYKVTATSELGESETIITLKVVDLQEEIVKADHSNIVSMTAIAGAMIISGALLTLITAGEVQSKTSYNRDGKVQQHEITMEELTPHETDVNNSTATPSGSDQDTASDQLLDDDDSESQTDESEDESCHTDNSRVDVQIEERHSSHDNTQSSTEEIEKIRTSNENSGGISESQTEVDEDGTESQTEVEGLDSEDEEASLSNDSMDDGSSSNENSDDDSSDEETSEEETS